MPHALDNPDGVLYKITNTRLLSSRHSATPVHRMYVVLQLSPIYCSGAELNLWTGVALLLEKAVMFF